VCGQILKGKTDFLIFKKLKRTKLILNTVSPIFMIQVPPFQHYAALKYDFDPCE
jgi:hypothetical protein